jgi:hypothetical protein
MHNQSIKVDHHLHVVGREDSVLAANLTVMRKETPKPVKRLEEKGGKIDRNTIAEEK